MNGKSDSHQLACVRRPRSTWLPPASAGNCCSAVSCDAVGTKEAKQKALYRNIEMILGLQSSPGGLAFTAAARTIHCQSPFCVFRSSRGGVTVLNQLIHPSLSMPLPCFFFFFFYWHIPSPGSAQPEVQPSLGVKSKQFHGFLAKKTTSVWVQSHNNRSLGRKTP